MIQASAGKRHIEHVPLNVFGRLNAHEKGKLLDALAGRPSKYELSFLGQGGCSNVRYVLDTESGSRFAVKTPLTEDDTYRVLLRREVAALTSVSHPNVVGYRGHAIGGEISFVAMDLVDGMPLEAMFSNLTLVEYAKVLAKVGLALDHCHERHVVHRDVKPSNVMVDLSTKNPTLIDFGLSVPTNTRPTTVAGTPEYLAPESATLPEINPKLDVHSLGVMLFERCRGKLIKMPDELKNFRNAHLFAAFHLELPLLPSGFNYLGENLDDKVHSDLVFVSALSRHPDPNLRFKSGKEFHDAVMAMIE